MNKSVKKCINKIKKYIKIRDKISSNGIKVLSRVNNDEYVQTNYWAGDPRRIENKK